MMCLQNIVLWCFVLLLVSSSSKSQRNFTTSDELNDNSMVRYHPLISSVKYRNHRSDNMEPTQCNSCENSIKNDDEMQYESRVNSTNKNDRKNDDSVWNESREHIKNREQSNQMSMEASSNSTEINDSILQEKKNLTKAEGESDSTSNELYKNSNADDYNNTAIIVPYEACNDVTCIQLCCPFGDNLTAQGKCVADGLAYIFNFSFLSSFFWLNVTCFDIWWTFRRFRSYQTSVKQDKKRFVMYSLYAWGITFILNVICVIMDYAPGIPESLIRPEMCAKNFWFSEDDAKTLYFYVPMGATIISNICFFTATTLTILCQNIRTAHQLRDSESKRHNENKQRFNMYLKLFIVMGITWVMELISWSINVDFVPPVFWFPIAIINSLQGVIIFIIFVCRKKIKQLLLKHFGGRNCGPFCKIPTNNDSTTNTASTSGSGTLPMQEISPSL